MAKASAEMQRYYDRLHHELRVRELSKSQKTTWDEREMLKSSKEILNGTRPGFRSVDLSDAAYLAQLDVFALEKTS